MNVPLQTRPTHVRYVVLAWTCSLAALTYLDRVCIKVVRNDMQQTLELDDQQFGWVFAAFALSYSLFEVPSGWLGDRFGTRQVLCRIVVWWSVFTILTGCVWKFNYELGYLPMPEFLTGWFEPIPLAFNSLVLLLTIRFLFGAGEAGAFPNASRALRNWFPYTQRGFGQGMLWAFGRWGGAASPGMVFLFALFFGWRGTFICFGILGALWVVFFAYCFRNTPAEHPGVNAAELELIQEKGDETAKPPLFLRTMLRSPTLWCLSVMYLCSNAGWSFFITWDEKYFETILRLSGIWLKLASAAPLFCGGVGCLAGGLVTDWLVRVLGRRWGRAVQGLIAYLLAGGFFLLALTFDRPLLAVASLCLGSFFKDFAMAVSWSTCIDIGHRYSGTVSGFMNMVGNMGTVFAPPIVAYLAKHGEWNLALVFSAAMFFSACGCWLFINPRKVIVYRDSDRTHLQAQGILQ